ncbi:MAG: CCA tRNA nucleotidyltransferase [Erysipelotrichaceae bacterium]|nr:CCA tRNA nucleotidyltransferase [Erysipelotrichaceae bacterium]
MNLNLPDYILFCINKLNNKNYECFVVGGAIRDHLLNKHVNDYDLATNATPNQIKEVFNSEPTFDSGIKHGTITVLINSNPIQITTYRSDGEYSDYRHPNEVYFTNSLKEDCRRRDFTINALCYHPQKGLIDFFDGIDDLNNKIIRSIDNPDKRFQEDALRIIRALRFSTLLDFQIEEKTKQSIFYNKELLLNISIERVTDELLKILSSNNCSKVIKEYFEIFKTIIPELNKIDKKNIIQLLSNELSSSTINLAILLLYIQKDAIGVMNKLKLPNTTKRKILFLLNNYDIDLSNKVNIKKTLNKNEEYFNDLLKFIKIINPSINDVEIKMKLEEIINNNEPYKLNQLVINGNDIKEMGFIDNEISNVLNNILTQIIEGKLDNNKREMISYVKRGCDR